MAGTEENDLTFYYGAKELFFPAFAYVPKTNLSLKEWFIQRTLKAVLLL